MSDKPVCFHDEIAKSVRESMKTDDGFMGLTHALSAVALVLAVLAFAPAAFDAVFGKTDPWYMTLLCLVIVGGALMPDLDNTNSSAESALGFIGSGISAFMRATAPLIQGLLHTKYDKDLDNPHRGFYHSGVSAILAGALGYFLCSMPGRTGKITSLVLAFIGVHIAVSTIAKKIIFKMKSKAGPIGFIVPLLISTGIVALLWRMLPVNVSYAKIGIAFGVGWLIHILGDMCTTQGVPILWPIPIRGKMWWHVRLLPIKAGGVIENFVFIPLFLVIIGVSIVFIVS